MSALISEKYRIQQEILHSKGNYGTTGKTYGALVTQLVLATSSRSILDYGCGSKQSLLTTLAVDEHVLYEGYDPAVPEYAANPIPADLVCCIDVLEHIEPDLLDGVLDHLASLCEPFGFFTVHTGPAVKVLDDGRNAHLIQEELSWWGPRLSKNFQILIARQVPSGFCVLVKSLRAEPSSIDDLVAIAPLKHLAPVESSDRTRNTSITTIKYKEHKIAFNTPNEMTAWRVKTLFTKEPDTIRWLETIPNNAVLLDVGANVGMYSLFAAVTRGAKVYAFEPESQNYGLLNSNIAANSVSQRVVAYPLALSDEMKLSHLHLAKFEPGSSCHSFGEQVGFDLKPRSAAFTQGSFSVTIDQLIEAGSMECPNFIKIDVDGIEHKVIAGAKKTLKNKRVESVIVELNTHLPEHMGAIQALLSHGFYYDQAQANGALRKSGAFEGVGEFIFTRKPTPSVSVDVFNQTFRVSPPPTALGRGVLRHLTSRVTEARIEHEPFPYLVVDNIFPEKYYQDIVKNFPDSSSLRPIGETGRVPLNQYKERHTVLFTSQEFDRLTESQRVFWNEFSSWMYTDQFLSLFLSKFSAELEPRISTIIGLDKELQLKGDALLVNDKTTYAIGPHTDAPHRLVTFLFYLPEDSSMKELGTSVYRHKDPEFKCWGGPHYPFDNFVKVKTLEYVPNRLIAFPKTEKSFHGVEEITRKNVNRPLLINNIRLLNKVTH